MINSVTIPVWLFLLFSLAATLLLLRLIAVPLWAWFLSSRNRSVIEEVNPLLQLHMSSFTLSQRRVLADRLVSDQSVEKSIEEIAEKRGESLEKTRREAWRIAWDIVPAFNPYFYFRIGYWVARGCLRALLNLRIAFEDESSMEKVSNEAAVLFVINHRSNIDYAIANYLTSSRTMLSFGVGEWSRIWPIQPLMRMAGGYFVRRDSDNPLYRHILKRYVQMATEARVPHAIFLEGQLSPDGSVGEPRLGLLSYITEHFDAENTPDLVFMPIGINYDHVLEDENMLRFSSAEFSEKGRRYIIIQGIQFVARVLWELIMRRKKYGYACAQFNKPVSFSKWLLEHGVSWPELTREDRFKWIALLGEQLIGNIREVIPATPVAILCRIWFDRPDIQLNFYDLEKQFFHILDALKESGCHIVLVDNDEKATFMHALNLTQNRGIVLKNAQGRYRSNPDKCALAAYYGNSLSQFFSI